VLLRRLFLHDRLESFDSRQHRLFLSQHAKLMKLGLKQLLVRQARLVFGDERGRHGSTEGVFNDFVIFCLAEQDADRGLLVRLPHVAVEGLKVELQFAEMLELELVVLSSNATRQLSARLKMSRLWLQLNSLTSGDSFGAVR
jgi:hypothetical protein